MDYSNLIIAFASVVAVVSSLSRILGKKFVEIDESIKEVRSDIHKLDKKISRIENRLEFSNKFANVQHEDLKEN